MTDAPRFENAPGVVVRARVDGTYAVFWQARSDLTKRGYRPYVVKLWRGTEPTDADRAFVSDTCTSQQTEMLIWGRDGIPEAAGPYDGTVRSLVNCYKTDPDSPFHKVRYSSRENYGHFLKRIVKDHGDAKIKEIKARDLLRWHEDWAKSGIPMASGLVGHFRGILTFGSTLLECKHCRDLKAVLADMRFPQGKPRDARLTAEMAIAFCAVAHAEGRHSMALAQAIQFEGMLRQRDVIGEWVPLDEPGISDVTTRKRKWLRGVLWSEIDADLVLRHITSKRQKEVEIRLGDAPMVVEEFGRIGTLPTSGPVIVNEATGLPYSVSQFRVLWRKLATKAGIPASVRNQDSRAGAISEATDAGAELEHIRHAATHSDIQMTQRYSRGSADKTATVLKMRVAHRNKPGT